MKSILPTGCFLLGLICCLLTGCTTERYRAYDDAASIFNARYHAGFTGWRMPSAEAIAKASQGDWQFNHPMDRTWKACLEVVSQYHGTIGMERGATTRTICVIRGRDSHLSAGDRVKEVTFAGCYEHWLAIALSEDSGETRVSLASVDPVTGELQPVPTAEQALYAQMKIQLDSVSRWAEKFADVDWSTRPARSGAITQKTRAARASGFEQYEITMGDWIAKRLRLDLGLVYCPELTDSLETAVNKLKAAAGLTDLPTKVRILGSPSLNAFAMPNGEIYISSGLLDSAQSVDEVAAVLAHEVVHLKNHDVTARLRKQQAGDTGAAALRTAWAFADVALQVVGGGGGLLTSIGGSAGKTTASMLTEKGADFLQTSYAENFSEDVELRTDEMGCETLYLAGFNVEANLTLLVGLKEKQGPVLAEKSTAMSNLINMKPGLDTRIEKMASVVSRLKSQSGQTP